MFKCIAQKHIYRRCDSDEEKELGCEARLNFSIPFAPYPGLMIHSAETYFTIEFVQYIIKEKSFLCRCKPDFLERMDGCGYEGLKSIAQEDGWELLNESPVGTFED